MSETRALAALLDAQAAPGDWLSEEGAKKLAVSINAFWKRKLTKMGRNPAAVTAWIVKEGNFGRDDRRRPVYGVRSNLLRGLPPS